MCARKGATTPETCPPPRCDPLNPPPGFACLDDPTIGCGLQCINPIFCPESSVGPNTPPPTSPNLQKKTTPAAPPVFTCGFYVGPGGLQIPCRAGYYCPAGNTTSTPIVPVKCPGGSYCGSATCKPLLCGCGFKCPEGSSAPTECRSPYYCPNQGATSQTLCPIGSKCDAPGMCLPTPCLPGTYVSCQGKVSCDPCALGRYCPTPTTSLLCPAGSSCPLGSSAPALCPAGFYCPLGSAQPLPCPAPASSAAGASSALHCTARRRLLDAISAASAARVPA